MIFFQKQYCEAVFSGAMTFAVRVRNQFEDTKVYCHCFCFQWTPEKRFWAVFTPAVFK